MTPCSATWTTETWPVGDHRCIRDLGHEPIVNGDPSPVDHLCVCGARTHV